MSKEKGLEDLKKTSKGKGGSWLYGFILMGLGILVIALGLLDLLNYNEVAGFLTDNGFADLALMIAIPGVVNFVIGLFSVIAGFGLIIDQEWAWGISMLILCYSTVMGAVYAFQQTASISVNPSNVWSLPIISISIVVIIISIAGLLYLGLTKYKYA